MQTQYFQTTQVPHDWHVIDCAHQSLGRLAVKIATLLRGKHKPTYTPNADVGDFVIAVNVEKLRLTGNKLEQKRYYRHSGYMGGIRSQSAKEVMETKPENVLKAAVKGMLPRNSLSNNMLTKLKMYRGSEHPHVAQMQKEAAV